jgi:hypothetical protein
MLISDDRDQFIFINKYPDFPEGEYQLEGHWGCTPCEITKNGLFKLMDDRSDHYKEHYKEPLKNLIGQEGILQLWGNDAIFYVHIKDSRVKQVETEEQYQNRIDKENEDEVWEKWNALSKEEQFEIITSHSYYKKETEEALADPEYVKRRNSKIAKLMCEPISKPLDYGSMGHKLLIIDDVTPQNQETIDKIWEIIRENNKLRILDDNKKIVE